MTTGDERGIDRGIERGIRISNVQGAFAIGDHNSVVNQPGAAPRDAAQQELLRAVVELRSDLARLNATEESTALDAELAAAQDEIEQSGAAGQGRVARLRQALTDASAVTGLVASAAAVVQAVAALTTGA